MKKNVIIASDSSFEEEVLKSTLPVLVDFWAPWCAPCRVVGPVVDELAGEYEGTFKFVKMNIDDEVDTAAAYGIMSIPTLAIFKDGKVVDGIIGAAPKPMLKEMIEKHLQVVATD
jgi:thioredoxin 1